jgi:hypothetical protein
MHTSTGCGDLVLAKQWRMLGPVVGLADILMCKWSTGHFFTVTSWVCTSRMEVG